MQHDYDRWRQLTALIQAWLAVPELDGDVQQVTLSYSRCDGDAAQLTRGLCDGYAHE